jgi:hypothetical protein
MVQTESPLGPQEVQLCLVLCYLMEELAILMEQLELLENTQQNHLRIILP